MAAFLVRSLHSPSPSPSSSLPGPGGSTEFSRRQGTGTGSGVRNNQNKINPLYGRAAKPGRRQASGSGRQGSCRLPSLKLKARCLPQNTFYANNNKNGGKQLALILKESKRQLASRCPGFVAACQACRLPACLKAFPACLPSTGRGTGFACPRPHKMYDRWKGG